MAAGRHRQWVCCFPPLFLNPEEIEWGGLVHLPGVCSPSLGLGGAAGWAKRPVWVNSLTQGELSYSTHQQGPVGELMMASPS